MKNRDVAAMTWAEFLREFNSKYYSQAVINSKMAKFTRLQQGNLSVLEYMRQFDQLSWYAPNMIQMETSKVWRFLSGLRPGLARLVDIGEMAQGCTPMLLGMRYDINYRRRLIRVWIWVLAVHRTKCYNWVHFRWWEVNIVVEGLGSRWGGPIIKRSLVDPVESLRQEVRGRVG